VLVIQPDSGHPATIVRKCLDILALKFGFIINKKGFKVINHVKILQGDGIDAESIQEICNLAIDGGYSISCIGFGMGGALLQKHHRDVQKFAMKCSHITSNGKSIHVFKDPITDSGKRSKKGRLDLIKNKNGEYETIELLDSQIQVENSEMVLVYENGKVLKTWTLDEVRKRAEL
jgi:nicotinamide phosphoribosyltransferase